MIRRMAGRVRRAIAARLVPLRESGRHAARELVRPWSSLAVIGRELGRATLPTSFRKDQRLRVGVDIRPFYEPLTGVGWYLYNLLEELSRIPELELVAFGDPMMTDDGPHLFVSLPTGVRMVGFDLRGRQLSRLSRPAAAASYALLAMLERCDVFFGANYFLPRAISLVARRRVITIHDLTYRRYPELLQDETLANLERQMLREIARADAVICVSESTRQDVLREYRVDPAKVVTIHSGIPTALSPAGRGWPPSTSLRAGSGPGEGSINRNYILFVSTIEPRKNLETLITAFEGLADDGRYTGDLVIVGKIGWKAAGIISHLQTSRWRDRIHHLDYLDREQLASVYRKADVFVLPSIYEGFGFPILEAMAQGVPVIAARSSSLPEIGGDAAMYFDPHDPEELADAIHRVVSDDQLRKLMVQKGTQRIANFRWEEAAARTAAVFRRVADLG